jgi:hypothetical protein
VPEGIRGRTPEECFRRFEQHMDGLLRRALDVEDWVRFNAYSIAGRPTAALTWRRGGGNNPATAIRVRQDPPLFLAARQELRAVSAEGATLRLRTVGYRYALMSSPDPREKAFVRWEFAGGVHHLQIPTVVGSLHLNDLHLPTGWVPLERVIRFLISEPAIALDPAAGKEQMIEELLASERRFFEQFADSDDLLGLGDLDAS